MKKYILVLAIFASINGFSQDIYQVAELSTTDLDGTSRYIGMGGAMGALGGDVSTMASSPAAIGLYRRGDVAGTLSFVTQPGGKKFDGKGKTHLSFDQLGFVYASPIGEEGLQYINFGINYHKNRNFNQLIESSFSDLSSHYYASQTMQLSDLSSYWGGPDVATPLTYMAYDAYLLADKDLDYASYGASANYYNKARWGSNQAFDFNISANISDQIYLGLTASAYNVTQKYRKAYGEELITSELNPDGYYILANENKLRGTGYDAKFGIIVRPVRESNFKVGLTLSTPTYYDLTYTNDSYLFTADNSWGEYDEYYNCDYDYKIRTPWKLNVSLGNTFFNRLAVGAEYEFADYSTCSVSYGDEFDDWSSKDKALNRQASKYLKSTHTLKVGAELMINPHLFVRGGYNYVNSAFDKDAYLNQFINSASVDAATSTDYLNLSAINRFTAGVGIKFGSFYADAAWQFQNQHGDFYAFSVASKEPFDYVPSSRNMCPSKRVKLNKSQVALTLGYRF